MYIQLDYAHVYPSHANVTGQAIYYTAWLELTSHAASPCAASDNTASALPVTHCYPTQPMQSGIEIMQSGMNTLNKRCLLGHTQA